MHHQPSERVRAPQAKLSVACFSVVAVPEPGVMPRVLQLFAKRGLVPDLWHSRVAPAGELTIDIQMAAMDGDTARYVADCLRAIWGVECVLTAEKAGVRRA